MFVVDGDSTRSEGGSARYLFRCSRCFHSLPKALVGWVDALAQDADGVTNVSFFDGSTFLGETNNTPYSITVNLAVGSHPLTAVATDNAGLSSTSSFVNVTIVSGSNAPPRVTITNPVDNATLSSSAALTIRAAAEDSDGTVTNVQFFDGLVSLGNGTNSPYSISARLAIGRIHSPRSLPTTLAPLPLPRPYT